MAVGMHYPIWVETPSNMDISIESFHNLSYYGISAFFVGWPFTIEKCEDMYKIYHSRWSDIILDNYRLEGLHIAEYTSVDLYRIDVPLDHPLIKTLDRFFPHLFLLEEGGNIYVEKDKE